MSSGPTLTAKLSNIQHMPALIAATVASDKPIDGYLIQDIVKMSYEAQQTRVFLQQYLVNLLSTSKNIYVKLKALRLIQALLQDGHADFHRNLRQNSSAIKEQTGLRPRDLALAGDCGRIRDLANKVLDLLYEEPQEKTLPSYVSPPSSSHGVGIGGGASSSSSGGGGGSSDRIVGFGHSADNKQKPGIISSSMDYLFRTPATKTVTYDEDYASMAAVPQSSSSYTHSSGRAYSNSSLPTGTGHVIGRPGGGWGESQTQHTNGDDQLPSPVTHHRSITTSSGSNEQERKLVAEITAPGGIKAAPPRDMLASFITRCGVLDAAAIVESLRGRLTAPEPQVALRSLFVMEALLHSDIPDTLSLLTQCLPDLTQLADTAAHPPTRSKATKLVRQLNGAAASTITTSSSAVTVNSGVAGTNNGGGALLSIGGETEQELVAECDQESEVSGLFAGLQVAPAHQSPRTVHRPSPTVAKKVVTTPPVTRAAPPPQAPPPSNNVEPLVLWGEDEQEKVEEETELDPLKAAAASGTSSGSSLLQELSSLDPPSATELLQPTMTTSTSLLDPTPSVSNTSSLPFSSMNSSVSVPPPVMPTIGIASMQQQQQQPMMAAMPGYAPVPQGLPMMNYGGVAAMSGVPGYMPAMYTMQQQQPGVMMSRGPMLVGAGGDARPVQIAAAAGTQSQTSGDSGFGFLGKSSKKSAFDFVEDEMRSATKK